MASSLVDLVKISVNSTGGGAITLGSAVEGYRGRDVLTNGTVYSYSIQQGAAWEFGRGTYLAEGEQLVRSVIDSSDGGTPIALKVGAEIAFTALSADLMPTTQLTVDIQADREAAEDARVGAETAEDGAVAAQGVATTKAGEAADSAALASGHADRAEDAEDAALIAAATAQEALGYKGKSARFPYRNRHNGDGSPFAMIAQPAANMGTWLGADGAIVATLTMPRERLRANATGQGNFARVFLGNVMDGASSKNFYCRVNGQAGVLQTRLEFYMRDVGTSIPLTTFLIPESYGSRLLVAFRRTSNAFTIDVWDCDTGTKYAGPSVDVTAFVGLAMTGLGSYVQIGAGGSTNTAPQVPAFSPTVFRSWEGDIGFVGYYNAALSDAACQAIALGGTVEGNTTAATWKYARELDGSVASLTKPAWATGDTTAAAEIVTSGGLEIERGSSITAKGTYFTVDRMVAGDAHVDAVMDGQSVKPVRVSGKVRSTLPAVDTVEMRFLTPDGLAVTGWQKIATVTPGDTTYIGYPIVPKGPVPYLRQSRLASQKNDPTKWFLDATRFGVGYRLLVLGQSQLANLKVTTRGLQYTGKTRFSWIEQSTEAATDISAINALVVHDRLPGIGDGVYGIMQAIDAAGCDAVVALEIQAVGGTSAIDWIKDSLSGRTWPPMLRSNEVMTGGRSCIVWNWDGNDIGTNYADVLNAVFCGTGPQAGDHFVFGPSTDGGSQIGATVAYMPVQRYNGLQTVETDYDNYEVWGTRRAEGLAWAAAKPFAVVGLAAVDTEMMDGAHPSTSLAAGTERHGQHVGLSAMRGIRQDRSTNPTVSAASFTFTDGTRVAFTFDVDLPNFGSIRNGLGATYESGADKTVRLIEVSSDGGVTWTKSGFTAVISGRNKVTVTKTSGAWAAGLKARVGFGGVGAYGAAPGITSGNIACRDYWMYDGYSRHVNGRGVPVLPSNTIYSVAG